MNASWRTWADEEVRAIHEAHRWRAPRDLDLDRSGTTGTLAPGGPSVISFASNDYLGLSHHPDVVAAAHDALDRWGTGSCSARLIVGSRPVHRELELELASWKRSEDAVLFNTGYSANLGVMTTFGGPDVLVCSDALNHASIVDGRRLAGSRLAVYRHLDLEHLDEILATTDASRAMVVSETVFSMDGDRACVPGLVELCARHGAFLVLDEAHGVLDDEPDLRRPDLGGVEVLRVGTLSKTLGALGGFVAGDRHYTDLLANQARSYIFTTASTPADTAAALAALRVVRSPVGVELRDRLRANISRLRPGHHTPIVPFVMGPEERALEAAETLRRHGLLVTAIRPPTVPPGTSRLRVTLSATHTFEQVDRLAQALAELSPSAMTRPDLVVFVAGTGTGVGKTWLGARLAALLRASGQAVSARKPVESFDPSDPGVPTDAATLAAATGERIEAVCRPDRSLPLAWAPPMARAELGGVPFSVADLIAELVWPERVAVGLIEGVGGLRSPVADDGDTIDLLVGVAPDRVVLVADAGLGTLNAVRLSIDTVRARTSTPVTVFLNRFDPDTPLHVRNRTWLEHRDGTAVAVVPELLARLLATGPAA